MTEKLTGEEREEREAFYAENPQWPRDEVVDGVELTLCTWCGYIAGRPGKGAAAPLLQKCGELFEFCGNWQKKSDFTPSP